MYFLLHQHLLLLHWLLHHKLPLLFLLMVAIPVAKSAAFIVQDVKSFLRAGETQLRVQIAGAPILLQCSWMHGSWLA